jgi:hypothetical protein
MTIKNLYPSVRPTLDLNFAQTKQLDPRITFSRSSSGTYFDNTGVLRTASANQARFDHDPVTGDSLGLLIEEARTNLLTYSEQFDNAAWLKTNATITANAVAAPDSATTADKIAATATAFSRVRQNVTVSGTYQVSIFAKPAELNWVHIYAGGAYAWFNISTGTVGTVNNGGFTASASIVKLPNGWYRCILSTNASANTEIRFQPADADNDSSVDTAGSGIYIWGAQVEVGSFPTSYIPTAGATVTRTADVAQITGANFSSWYNQSEGTIATELIPDATTNSSIWTVSDGTASEQMLSYSGTDFSFYVVNNGAAQVQYTAGGYTVGLPLKAASAFATNNFNYARGGVVYTTDTSGSLPTVDRLQLMAGQSGGQIQSGHLRRFTFYPVRLSDATLRVLTL